MLVAPPLPVAMSGLPVAPLGVPLSVKVDDEPLKSVSPPPSVSVAPLEAKSLPVLATLTAPEINPRPATEGPCSEPLTETEFVPVADPVVLFTRKVPLPTLVTPVYVLAALNVTTLVAPPFIVTSIN